MFGTNRYPKFIVFILLGASPPCFAEPTDEIPKIIGTSYAENGYFSFCFERPKTEELLSEDISDATLKLETTVEKLRNKKMVASLEIHTRRETASHLVLADSTKRQLKDGDQFGSLCGNKVVVGLILGQKMKVIWNIRENSGFMPDHQVFVETPLQISALNQNALDLFSRQIELVIDQYKPEIDGIGVASDGVDTDVTALLNCKGVTGCFAELVAHPYAKNPVSLAMIHQQLFPNEAKNILAHGLAVESTR